MPAFSNCNMFFFPPSFQSVLQDITREKELLESEVIEYRTRLNCLEAAASKAAADGRKVSKINDGICLSPVKLLQSRLKHQEDRCLQLQEAIMEQQKHSKKILQGEGEKMIL